MSNETTSAAVAEAEERRAELTQQLASVRAELRVKQPELARLKVVVLNQQAAEDNLRRKILSRRDTINTLHAERPAVADVLPDDPDVLNWRAAVEAREAEVLALQDELRAMPNINLLRTEGVELTQRIQALQHAEVNLLNALSAVPKKFWGGRAVESSILGVS